MSMRRTGEYIEGEGERIVTVDGEIGNVGGHLASCEKVKRNKEERKGIIVSKRKGRDIFKIVIIYSTYVKWKREEKKVMTHQTHGSKFNFKNFKETGKE